MDTVTFKLDRSHIQKLKERARAAGVSQAAIIRELIDRHLSEKSSGTSLHDRARDLCGSVAGSKDMSTRKLRGYGRN